MKLEAVMCWWMVAALSLFYVMGAVIGVWVIEMLVIHGLMVAVAALITYLTWIDEKENR